MQHTKPDVNVSRFEIQKSYLIKSCAVVDRNIITHNALF